ncbi:MAG: DoxX family protein [Bacteroidota bacterium]
MNQQLRSFLWGSNASSLSFHIGSLLLRFFVGLAFCTVFEKFLPGPEGWGPETWFIEDVREMGFPFPVVFAWAAVLSEFFGGLLMMCGCLTRPAALLNAIVTFSATFLYHHGDIGGEGLLSFFFFIMCLVIVLFGAGKFSVDHWVWRRSNQQATSGSSSQT